MFLRRSRISKVQFHGLFKRDFCRWFLRFSEYLDSALESAWNALQDESKNAPKVQQNIRELTPFWGQLFRKSSQLREPFSSKFLKFHRPCYSALKSPFRDLQDVLSSFPKCFLVFEIEIECENVTLSQNQNDILYTKGSVPLQFSSAREARDDWNDELPSF